MGWWSTCPCVTASTVFVPGGDMHQFKNTGDGVLRFICLVPQEWLLGVDKPDV